MQSPLAPRAAHRAVWRCPEGLSVRLRLPQDLRDGSSAAQDPPCAPAGGARHRHLGSREAPQRPGKVHAGRQQDVHLFPLGSFDPRSLCCTWQGRRERRYRRSEAVPPERPTSTCRRSKRAWISASFQTGTSWLAAPLDTTSTTRCAASTRLSGPGPAGSLRAHALGSLATGP